MDSHSDAFLERKDYEKAKALDRAIEFEDAPPHGCAGRRPSVRASTGDPCVAPTSPQSGKAPSMNIIDSELMEELNLASGQLVDAQNHFRAICGKIAATGPEGIAAVPAAKLAWIPPLAMDAGGATAGTRDPGHRATGIGRGHRTPVEGDPAAGVKSQAYHKVACLVCGKQTGSRLYQDQRYPVLHKNQQTGEHCKGSFKPGTPAK